MQEHPILFSTENVKAILEGRKIQTRRVVKPQPRVILDLFQHNGNAYVQTNLLERDKNLLNGCIKCPYGQVGDRLWCKETFCQVCFKKDGERDVCYKEDLDVEHMACKLVKFTPSIFMPRWASRITLEITGIRVQRLREISHEDITVEGFGDGYTDIGWNYVFGQAWNKINGKKYPWKLNPWVWCLEFKLVGK